MPDWETLLKRAKEAFEQNRNEEALTILNEATNSDNGDAIFLKGEIYFKLQKWGEAHNQFSLFLEKYPSDLKAESYCAIIQNILGFYHKDLYNP